MILIGFGLYAAYVPFGCILFDRLIATVNAVGTAGFLIYVTDAFGYLGSVGLVLYKDIGSPDLSWLEFFKVASYATAIFCTALYLVSLLYFWRLRPSQSSRNLNSVAELAAESIGPAHQKSEVRDVR